MTADEGSSGEPAAPAKDQPEPTVEVAPELSSSSAAGETAPQDTSSAAEEAERKDSGETGSKPRSARARSPRRDQSAENSAGQAEKEPPPGRGRPALWAWILGGLIALAILLLVQDLKNRNRYLLVCTANGQELHRGRRFPWPFGDVPIGGPELKPIPQASPQDCVERSFTSELEAKEAFLDALLSRARTELTEATDAKLEEVRREVQQALLLTEELPHRKRAVERLLAQVSYQEGKAGLQRAERDLRLALSRFQEAQKLGGDRFNDLEEWISHLEQMLHALAPSPFASPTPLPGPLLPGDNLPTSRPSQPLSPLPHGGASQPARATDGGPAPAAPDAGGTSGILM